MLSIKKISYVLPRFHFKIEKWKWNKKYNVYVSTMGNFKDKNGKPIRPRVDRSGYLRLLVPSQNKNVSCHRLVLTTWQPCDDMEVLTVDHKDSNKRNNCLSNLEWCSEEENLRRADENLVNPTKELEHMVTKFFKGELQLKNDNTILDVKNFGEFLRAKGLVDQSEEYYIKRFINQSRKKLKYCGLKWKIV